MSIYTYEESVKWMREQSEHSELVKLCYLDEDNWVAANRFSSSEEFSEIVKLLRLHTKLKILDLGCGNGIASYAFASLGHDVSAVDPDLSEDVGLEATARLASNVSNGSITTFHAVAESLPFPDSTFDVVYARQALHHFSDLHKGLAECSRVLKPQACFLATREHVVNDEQQLKVFLESHLLHKLHGGENAYPLNDYISALKQSGLRVIQCLAPFDTVINHFPISNMQVKQWLFQVIEKKLGQAAASVLAKFYPVESLYRYRLSRSCDSPGRLYSFFCIKEGNR
ncbi:MAG: class I SAM-dependent methyltransferase [Coleofasciculus sp. C1-SOL-03]|uniref:class I SAM-dependent methyltransferase n=1 Tax=Coleofasciculus sp. C1-SOL-03 TaxID=3069522 RepID=UPI0032F7CDD2